MASTTGNLHYYFAYGSNLMLERLRIRNKSANFFAKARLEKYKLVFTNKLGRSWGGSVASLLKTDNDSNEVWGVVYTLLEEDLDQLARQEGGYEKVELTVEIIDDGDAKNRQNLVQCISYIHPEQLGENALHPPQSSLPSLHYLSVIVHGAVRSGLPESYVERLRNHPIAVPKSDPYLFEHLVALTNGELKLLNDYDLSTSQKLHHAVVKKQ